MQQSKFLSLLFEKIHISSLLIIFHIKAYQHLTNGLNDPVPHISYLPRQSLAIPTRQWANTTKDALHRETCLLGVTQY